MQVVADVSASLSSFDVHPWSEHVVRSLVGNALAISVAARLQQEAEAGQLVNPPSPTSG